MNDRKTVFITGGTGFIGAYTAAELLKHGHEVVLYDVQTNSPLIEALEIRDEVRTIRGDITDQPAVFRAIQETGATHLIHLAALLTNTTRANPRVAVDVNVIGTTTMLEAARLFEAQVERLVWASSSAVYAPPEAYDGGQLTETDLLRPKTLYGAAKAYNERQAEVYRTEYGVSHVGLRPTLVYGPYRQSGSATTYASVIENPANGEPVTVGPGETILDWQYVADAAQAFRKAAFAPDSALNHRSYNVCGNQATLEEVADVVHELLPDASIDVTDEGNIPWTHTMSDAAARDDFGYDPQYDLETGVRAYINRLRADSDLEPV